MADKDNDGCYSWIVAIVIVAVALAACLAVSILGGSK